MELIKQITIKKDGVYISTKSSNDSSNYTSVKNESLTETYKNNGQEGLDKRIIELCLDCCELRGNHNSILPYKNVINKMYDYPEFMDMFYKIRELENKTFSIANGFDEFQNLPKDKKEEIYIESKNELNKLQQNRNNFILNLVRAERRNLFGPKELNDGIYEIIPVHNVKEGYDVYSEYMNFNSNNGTIIYEIRLGNLLPSPDIIKISEYEELINKSGIDKVNGAKEFRQFVEKYPEIYMKGLESEKHNLENISIEENEETEI